MVWVQGHLHRQGALYPHSVQPGEQHARQASWFQLQQEAAKTSEKCVKKGEDT